MAGHEHSRDEKSSNLSSSSKTANNNSPPKHTYDSTPTKPALPRTGAPENALTTTPPSFSLLNARQNNPQDCQNLIAASVNRATVEISRTIIALNATFSQQLQAASQSASNGIRSAQESANSSIKVVVQSASVATVAAFSSVTVANRQVTSANLALTDAQASASAALSSANLSLAVASQSLVGANSALGDARGNVSSLSLVSLSISSASLSVSSGSASVSSGSLSVSSASLSEVVRLSASLTVLAASVSSIQASAFLAIAAAQSALASVTGSAAAQASAILASAASATRVQGGPQTVFVGSPSMDGQPVVVKSPNTITPIQIAAIAIGSVVALLLSIGIAFFFFIQARRKAKRDVSLDEKTLPSSPKRSLPRLNSTIRSENQRVTKFNPPKSSEAPRPSRSALKSQGTISIPRDSIPPNVPKVPEVPRIDAQIIQAHTPLVSDFSLEIWPVNFDLLTPEVDNFPATPGLIDPIIPLPIDKTPVADVDEKAHNPGLLVQKTPTSISKHEDVEDVVLNPFEDPLEPVAVDFSPSTPISANPVIMLSAIPVPPPKSTIINTDPFADAISQEDEHKPLPAIESEEGEEEEEEEEEEEGPSPRANTLIDTTVQISSQEIPEVEVLIEPLFSNDSNEKSVLPLSTEREITCQDLETENANKPLLSNPTTTPELLEAKVERNISPLRSNPQNRNAASLLLERTTTEDLPQVAESLVSYQDPEIGNANEPLPPSILIQTPELTKAKAERNISPQRRNSQIRTIASLLLESTATENLLQVAESPPEENEEPETRGRSMIRTSDIIIARLSQTLQSSAQKLHTEMEAHNSDERALIPLPHIEVENVKFLNEISERTLSPLQRNPSLFVPSVKRKSRTLSPRKPTQNSLSLRDRTESPLRRNPVDIASVAKFLEGSTAPARPPLNINKTTVAAATPTATVTPSSPPIQSPTFPTSSASAFTSTIQTSRRLMPPPVPPPVTNPKQPQRSRSAPRPASNAAFAQTLSRFRDLAAREQIQAKQASSEVTQRARAGIFIPGSLREQAVRNLSRNREQEKGRKR